MAKFWNTAAAFAVAALCLLGLFCYTLFRGKLDWPLLLLVLVAVCHSLYWLGSSICASI